VNLPHGNSAIETGSPRKGARFVSQLKRPSAPPLWLGLVVAASLIVAETLVLFALKRVASVDSLAVIYLVGVVVVAILWGFWLAAVTSVASALTLGYFYVEPLYSLGITHSANWVSMAVFLVVGALASILTDRVRSRAVAEAESEHKRADDELSYQMQLLKTVTDNASSALYIVDTTGLGTFVNPALERISGYRAEELIGQIVHDKIHHTKPDGTPYPVHECPLTGAVQQRRVLHGEDLFVRKDDTFFPIRYTASPIFRDGVAVCTAIEVEDLTERTQAEEALRQAQAELARVARVITMGQLTASIAHEVSGPIATAVISARTAQLCLNEHPPDLEEVGKVLEGIINNCRRADEVIDRISSLVKKAPPRKVGMDLNDAIRDILPLTWSEVVKRGVDLQTELAMELALVEGDRVQLQQVVLNLILNAVEAMSGLDEGARQLQISTKTDPANGVLVAVRDTGPGLDPTSGDRLFEAFYTTKPEGMGMGLAICRSIIDAHGGRLWATANEPRGTVFQFTLPTHDETAVPAERGRTA
jgi:PAS domain S-box-containing protein